MEKFDIFQDIAERTGGSIYIGVVGPVRTGKSTFIKRFMDLMVIPNISNDYDRQRAQDELPQSGSGRTIMTTEPKFVPDEAITVALNGALTFKVRLVDCVGYTVPGALGYEENDGPRMVRTPWFDDEIPFEEAAEIGTRKVITEHSTLGLVVLTDGSITELDRDAYLDAEKRVIAELKELQKPFIILLNSVHPGARATQDLAAELSEIHNVPVYPVDCLQMEQQDVLAILQGILYEFPVREIGLNLPRWVEELQDRHWLREKYNEAIFATVEEIERLRDIDTAIQQLQGYDFIEEVNIGRIDLGTGNAVINLGAGQGLFYQVLSDLTGFEIEGDHHLLRLMSELSMAKQDYDKIVGALNEVREMGYGIVVPDLSDITFDEPELIRQGNRFGVKLKASAPSIHMVRANIMTEVTPFVGTEKQGEELVRYLNDEFEKAPERIWNSDFLGKSLQDLIQEGIHGKLQKMPGNAREKLQEALTKIINEGNGGLICIIF